MTGEPRSHKPKSREGIKMTILFLRTPAQDHNTYMYDGLLESEARSSLTIRITKWLGHVHVFSS